MACIELTVTPVAPAVLDVNPLDGASLTVEPVDGASLSVVPNDGAVLTVTPQEGCTLSVVPQDGCTLTIGEVCSITGGTIVVLAASDGPLRTRDGGYILLDPRYNPPQS